MAASIAMIGSYTYPASDGTPNAPATTTFSTTGPYSINVAIANQVAGSAELENVNWLLDEHQGLFINRSMDMLSDDGADALNWAGRFNGTFFTMAGGNDKDVQTDCARVWNGLCVGWYAYNTYNNTSTHVRFVSAGPQGSSYKNPPANLLFERPHLLGPGGHTSGSGLHMPSVTAASGMTYRYLDLTSDIFGSSFSAPAVLGAGITALEYSGWFSIVSYPVVNKAVILAGTIDSNADGAIGNANSWPHSSAVDYEDGAGHVDYRLVKAIIDNNRFYTANLSNSSFVACGTGCREYTVATVTVPALKQIRTALAWNACSARTSTAFLNNDLDLYVVPPAACGVPGYVSDTGLTSEIEMVQSTCTPQAQATSWTIKVRIKNGGNLNSCGHGTTERIGVAWAAI